MKDTERNPVYDADDPRLIQAAEESGLAAEYANDPELLRFYMKRLLRRGWAGQKSATEEKYTALVHRTFGIYQEHAKRLQRNDLDNLPECSQVRCVGAKTPHETRPGAKSIHDTHPPKIRPVLRKKVGVL